MKKITTSDEKTDKVVQVVQANAAPSATAEAWTYSKDAGGDWRGVSSNGQLRTRLKGTRDWAKKDVELGRLQYRSGRVWIDEIDGVRNRWTVPATDLDLAPSLGGGGHPKEEESHELAPKP